MQTNYHWLMRRLIAGATVPLIAWALTTPVWAQDTSKEETTTPTTTSQSDDETKTDADTDQETNQTTSQTTKSTTQSERDASTSTRRTAQKNETPSRSSAQSDSTRSAERSDDDETTGPALSGRRDVRDSARDAMRDTRSQARDTAREARQSGRESLRDAREDARDTRRDYRDQWQDTRRDTRDARRDLRQESDWRSDLRDDVRDFARDAAEYGRRTAREAIDSARDENWQDRDAGREWDEYGRATRRESQEFADDTFRDSRDFDRDDDSRRDRFDDRDSFERRDSFRDSREDYARDSFRSQDDARSFDRDSFGDDRNTRDRRSEFRSDRDSRFTDVRRDARDTRITRSQIDNFRATSVSTRDLGLSLARTSRGLIVDDVRSGALAATIGLRPNDRIVAVEDYRVTSEDQFVRYLFDEDWRHDRISVIVVRDGRQVPIYVRPAQLIERLIVVRDDYDPFATFGIVLDDRYDDELVIRHVWPNTVAHRAGLRPGDVIVRFYGQRLTSPRQFVQVLNRVDARQAPIVVERDRNLREFVVSMPSDLRMSSEQRTTYRRQLDSDRFDNRGNQQWRDQGTQLQYGGEVFQDTYSAPSGVITTQPAQVFPGQAFPRQVQPAQPVQPPSRIDDGSERPGILPRLFGR